LRRHAATLGVPVSAAKRTWSGRRQAAAFDSTRTSVAPNGTERYAASRPLPEYQIESKLSRRAFRSDLSHVLTKCIDAGRVGPIIVIRKTMTTFEWVRCAMSDVEFPVTHYALSVDVSIAYQTMGDGPIDLIIVPGMVSHRVHA
jgi:hypothetical protein